MKMNKTTDGIRSAFKAFRVLASFAMHAASLRALMFAALALAAADARAAKLGEGITAYYAFGTGSSFAGQKWSSGALATDASLVFNASGGSINRNGNNPVFGDSDYVLSGGNGSCHVNSVDADMAYPATSGNWTLSLLAKRDGASALPCLYCHSSLSYNTTAMNEPSEGVNGGVAVYVLSDGRVKVGFSTTSDGTAYTWHTITSESSFTWENTLTAWHSVIVTRDGTTVSLFVDDTAQGSAEIGASDNLSLPSGSRLSLSSASAMGMQNGTEDLCFWNRALTASEIAKIAGKTSSIASVANFRCGSCEESGSFVTRLSQPAFRNASIADLTADTLRARVGGGYVNAGVRGSAATFCNFSYAQDNSYMTCEAQIQDSNFIKGFVLRFDQDGADVNVRVTDVRYVENGTLGSSVAGGDLSEYGRPAASYTGNGYGLYNLRLSRTDGWQDATVAWQTGEFDMIKVGSDGNAYSLTLPASGMSITDGNLVVASSGATTGATINLPSGLTKVSSIIKYSSLAAVGDKNVTLATIKDSDSHVIGARTSANGALSLTGYYDESDTSYPNDDASDGSGVVPSLLSGSGYFLFGHYPGDGTGNGTYSYAGYSPFLLSGGYNTRIRWGSKTISQISIGGPITSTRASAWPDAVIEAVALYVGSVKTAGDVEDFEFTPTKEATISADGTYTLAGLFTSTEPDGEYVINVEESATLNIDAATTVNMITFNVASGKTLTLTGSTLTATGGIKVIGEGKVETSVAAVLNGTLKGDGTLSYVMGGTTAKPTGINCARSAWKGVVSIENSKGSANPLLFSDYGNSGSTLRLSDVQMYVNKSGGTSAAAAVDTFRGTLEIGSGGLEINNGNAYTAAFVGRLAGQGELKVSGGSANGNALVVMDSSSFCGTLNVSASKYIVTFGDTGYLGTTGKVTVNAGKTAAIPTGKTWTAAGGFEVNGTLAFAGTGKASGNVTTANGSVLDLSAYSGETPAVSGTLTLASGTTVKLPAGTTLPYRISTSGSGTVGSCVIGDGAALTYVPLRDGLLMTTRTAEVSGVKTFSAITWNGDTSSAYAVLTVTGETALDFDSVSGIDLLTVSVQSGAALYVKNEDNLTCDVEFDGLGALTIPDSGSATFYAGYTRLYDTIGTTSTGDGALSATGRIGVNDTYVNLAAGSYTLARWLTPQKLSTGYGAVPDTNVSVTPGVADGLSRELVYMADRIVLRVYDATAQAAKGTLRIWPYGDSITEGYNGSGTRANYRVLLAQKLSLLGYNVKMVGCTDKIQTSNNNESAMASAIDPAGQIAPADWQWHSAKHGAPVMAGISGLAGRGALSENVDTLCAQAGNPDIVLLHIGVNDLSQTSDVQGVFDAWTNTVWRILNNLPDTKVVVSTVLYNNADLTSQLNSRVTTLNEKIRVQMSEEAALPFTSGRVVLADLNSAIPSRVSGYLCSSDNLHPDWWGHDIMAEGWLYQIRALYPDSSATFPSATEIAAPTSGELGAANKPDLDGYRQGFKRYGVINATNGLDPSSYTYTDVDATAAASGIARVGYFVEYVRADNNASHWVWVDMDAFGSTIADLGLPSVTHQQVVNNLHVKSSHGAIDDVAADDNSVQGFIEFSPYDYSGTTSGITGSPTGWSSSFDWNDTFDENAYGSMQVHRIAPPSGRAGQVLFAFNGWNQSSTEAEFGIGNFAQHFYGGGTQSIDYTKTASMSTMNAAAYSVKTIEIWTNPDRLVFSNDKKGTSTNYANFTPGTDTWTITIPGSGGKARLDEIDLGLRSDNSTELGRCTVARLAVYSGDTPVAFSEPINGTGEKQTTEKMGDGAYIQRFVFAEDCVLEEGTPYTLKMLTSAGEGGVWPAWLEAYSDAAQHSPVVQSTSFTAAWRIAQTVYATKVYEATVSADASFSGLTFSPSLPPDSSECEILVNVTADAELTLGQDGICAGTIRFNVAEGVTLTVADPSNLTAEKVIVIGPGTLAFGDSPDFGDADMEIASDATVALSAGQTLTTSGTLTVCDDATLTLAPSAITSASATLVEAGGVSGEIVMDPPVEAGYLYDISIDTTSGAQITLIREAEASETFTYTPVPGESPSGWFSAWDGGAFSTRLRVGPDAVQWRVWETAANELPYASVATQFASRDRSFSLSLYADVNEVKPAGGKRAILASIGGAASAGKGGFLLYRKGDSVCFCGFYNGMLSPEDTVSLPVPADGGYHLWTATYDSATHTVALYMDEGGSGMASSGTVSGLTQYPLETVSAPYLCIGSFANDSKPVSGNWADGVNLACAKILGYEAALSPVQVAGLAQSYPATGRTFGFTADIDHIDRTLTVYSCEQTNGYIGVSSGTLSVPAGETVYTTQLRILNSDDETDRATVNIAGDVYVTTTTDSADVWSYNDDVPPKGILFGHWHGQGTYNITGSLVGTNAYLESVYTAEDQAVNIYGGGLVKVRGIYARWANGVSTFGVTNGTLEVDGFPSGSQPIRYCFGDSARYRLYPSADTATVVHSGAIEFTGTKASPTVLDPNGNRTFQFDADEFTGSGFITAGNSFSGGTGKVKLVGGESFDGTVLLTCAAAKYIDLSGFKGTVSLGEAPTADVYAALDGFTGTLELVSETGFEFNARDIDLSDAKVDVSGVTYVDDADEEGVVHLAVGTSRCILYVSNDQFLYEGNVYKGTLYSGATVAYRHSEANEEWFTAFAYSSGDEFSAAENEVVRSGTNLVPFYRRFVGDYEGLASGEYSGTLSQIDHWMLKDGDPLPTAGNVAIYVRGGNTLRVNVDRASSFGEVQVYGSGTVIFEGTGAVTVGTGLYVATGVTVDVRSGVSVTGADGVQARTGAVAKLSCGTAETPYEIEQFDGWGSLEISDGAYVKIDAVPGSPRAISVAGVLVFDDAGQVAVAQPTILPTGSMYVLNGTEFAGGVYMTVNGSVFVDGTSQFYPYTQRTYDPNTGNTYSQTATLLGSGTIRWAGAPPADEGFLSKVQYAPTNPNAPRWTGTNWIVNCTGLTDFTPQSYGNAGSVVRLTGVTGKLASGNTCAVPVELRDDPDDPSSVALEITDGDSGTTLDFAKVFGSGTLKTAVMSGKWPAMNIRIRDWSGFTGDLEVNRGRVVFGTDEVGYGDPGSNLAPDSSIPWMSIYISSDADVTIPAGATWSASGGLAVAGTLDVNDATTLLGANAKFKNGSTLKLRDSAVGAGTLILPASGTMTIDYGSLVGTLDMGTPVLTNIAACADFTDDSFISKIAFANDTGARAVWKGNADGTKNIVVYKAIPVASDGTPVTVPLSWINGRAAVSEITGAATVAAMSAPVGTLRGANGHTYLESYAFGLDPSVASSALAVGGMSVSGGSIIFSLANTVAPPEGVYLTLRMKGGAPGAAMQTLGGSAEIVGDGTAASGTTVAVPIPSVSAGATVFKMEVSISGPPEP